MSRNLSHLNARGEASMVNVRAKKITQRNAVAGCQILMNPETLVLLQSGRVKKGDAFTVAKIAAIQAVKRTAEIIPLCHPLPLEHIDIYFETTGKGNAVAVRCEVTATSKTGVEMEALHGVLIAALTLYDMAKAHDPAMTITEAKLLKKTGGKSL